MLCSTSSIGSRLEQKSTLVRKRIEGHTFDDEAGDEYEGSKFGGFPKYFRRKKIKLQNKDAQLRTQSGDKPNIFKGRIEGHTFDDEAGDEYEGSKFGGFPEYSRRKKIKLQNKDAQLRTQSGDKPNIFKGVVCHVNGCTQPSYNDLYTMIVQHGGGFPKDVQLWTQPGDKPNIFKGVVCHVNGYTQPSLNDLHTMIV
ncbi:deoxycytidyl transferase [Elasticomyces elasticus]|nr:deoxycytidyl transferase [Elasticomyces elasticus]